MAVLYNKSDTRPRSVSHSATNSSHLNIPTSANNGKPDVSNSSSNLTESPFPNSSYQQLPTNDIEDHKTITNTLMVPNRFYMKNPSPSCMKKKTDDLTPPMTYRVKFV
jgi:hypothetical protein